MERILFEAKMLTSTFMKLVSIVSVIDDDFKMGYDKDGIILRVMDDGHVSLFALDIPKDELISWFCPQQGVCEFALREIKNTIIPKGNAVITLKAYTTEKLGNYILDVVNEEIGENKEIIEKLTLTISVEVDKGSLGKIPSVLANTSVVFVNKDLLGDLQKIRIVSDYVTLIAGKKLTLKSDKSDSEDLEGNPELTIVKNVKCNGIGIGTYNIEYILPILRIIEGKFEIKWDSEKPLQILFEIEDSIGIYFLAPKVVR